MVRRSTIILLEVVIGLIALAVILGGVAVWRLSQGPLPLGFLASELETALSDPERGISVSIETTVLVWSPQTQSVDLQARTVRITSPQAKQQAILPSVTVELSLGALLRGVIAPEVIEVRGAQVTVVRDDEGRFSFGQESTESLDTDPDIGGAEFSALVPGILNVLAQKPSSDRPISFLKAVQARNGAFTIVDLAAGRTIRAPFNVIEVRRDRVGLAGSVRLGETAGGEFKSLALDFRYRKAVQIIDLDATFTGVRPGALATLEPGFETLSSLHIPLDGKVSVVMKPTGLVRGLKFELTGGPGILDLPDVFAEILVLNHLELAGGWDPNLNQLSLNKGILQLGQEGAGPKLTFNAELSGDTRDAVLSFAGQVDGLGAKALGTYWPKTVAQGGREWVLENVRQGWAGNAEVQVQAKVTNADMAALEVLSVDGKFDYRDVVIHYFRPLPPAEGLSGTAIFDAESMTFKPKTATIGSLALNDITIIMSGFSEPVERVSIATAAQGSLREVLTILDQEPLRLISPLGLQPTAVDGDVEFEASFALPMIETLGFDDVKIAVEGKGRNVVARDAVLGQDIEKAAIALKLDRTAMTVEGNAALNQYPVDFTWTETFVESDQPATAVEAHFPAFDHKALADLGLDLRPYVSGPLAVDLKIILDAQRSGTIDIGADLKQAIFDLPFLYWVKPAGQEGKLGLQLQLVDEKITEIDNLRIIGPDFRVVGEADLAPKSFSQGQFDLTELAYGSNRLSDVHIRLVPGGAEIAVGGGHFDVEPFLSVSDETGEEAQDEDPFSFRVKAPKLERVYFAEDRFLEEVALDLERWQGEWRIFSIDARLPASTWPQPKPAPQDNTAAPAKRQKGNLKHEGYEDDFEPEPIRQQVESPPDNNDSPAPQQTGERWVRLHYGLNPDGGYRVEATADDFGALLRATNIHDSVYGGQMRLSGTGVGPLPQHSLMGQLEVLDYTLVEAPILAKVLTLASFTGILDTMGGNGIRFDRLIGEYSLKDGVVHSELMRTYGPALGITLKGDVDTDQNTLILEGTVVPAYTINHILGEIPLLGVLLVGGEGQGLLAITYGVKGSIDDPDVSVNPLSVLAPGFLRGLFGGFGGIEEGEATVFPEGNNR